MTYCPVCRTDYQTTAHFCHGIGKIFTPNPDYPEVQVHELRARVAELENALDLVLSHFEEPCRLDHHGYCQEHFIQDDCDIAIAKKIRSL